MWFWPGALRGVGRDENTGSETQRPTDGRAEDVRDTDRQGKNPVRETEPRTGQERTAGKRAVMPTTGRAAGRQMDQSVEGWKPQAERPTGRRKKADRLAPECRS